MTEIAPVVESEDVAVDAAPVAEKAPVKKALAKKVVAPKKSVSAVAGGGPVYVARRQLTVGEKKYKPGDIVPEANGWTRVETWVRAGYIDVQGA